MKKRFLMGVFLLLLFAFGCQHALDHQAEVKEEDNVKIEMDVNGENFEVYLESNKAAQELVDLLPLSIELRDFGGFEKVGSIGTSLTTQDQYITTNPGDIVLYQGNQIVLFYGSNSWSYTRLGYIEDVDRFEEIVGNGNIKITMRKVTS